MTGAPKKRITPNEKKFADLMIDSGLGSIEAARKVFGWRCEPGSSEARRAISLKRSRRVQEYLRQKEEVIVREVEAQDIVLNEKSLNWDQIRKFAFERLNFIRDDETAKSQVRFNAINALEKLADPSSDSALIFLWLNLLWRGAKAHCPKCHNTFPLAKIKNKSLDDYWENNNLENSEPKVNDLDRRMEIIEKSDPGKSPHIDQTRALAANERHIVTTAPARAGKSKLIAWLALLFFMTPGVEIWVLARIYEDARSEVSYLRNFLKSLFYPFSDKMISESFDSKTGELLLKSRWGSELRVKSAKAKGSITGRELEAALVAEPAWVPEDLYEELRARMTSRLGRIIMMGTPKGFGGILGRMLNLTFRDPKTNRIRKIGPDERTLAAGCNWESSLLYYKMDPKNNPEYVKSELESAKMELLEHEYASEFEGSMHSTIGAKFPNIRDHHLQNIPFNYMSNCVFVLGVDQGPKNFAAVLIGYDGTRVYVINEYFETDHRTMKYHMDVLRQLVPTWIHKAGGSDKAWNLTIFDADPPVHNELVEFESEAKEWPTPVTFRPKNQAGKHNMMNWRAETYEYVNSLSLPSDSNLIFSVQNCELLHDQMKKVQNVPETPDRDTTTVTRKHWYIVDPWRGDHCFHPNTEALTKDGWKYIGDIKIGDIIMSRSPAGKIVWVPVTNTIRKFYDGDMISFNTQKNNGGPSFVVTPDHNLYYVSHNDLKSNSNRIRFISAGELYNSKIKTGKHIPTKSIFSPLGEGLINKFNFKTTEDFSYYLGFYLAEGCFHPTRPYSHVDQVTPDILKTIQESRIDEKMGSLYHQSTCYRLSFFDYDLYNILKPLGNSGNKYIPRWFFDNANYEEHLALYKGMMDGDGTWSQRKYDSVSERLIDDFQELISRLGVVSTKSQTAEERQCEMPRGVISNCKPSYRLKYRRLDKEKSFYTLKNTNTQDTLKKTHYKGDVVCVSAPPHNVIFIRHNGRTTWIGQCLDALMLSIWTIVSHQIIVEIDHNKPPGDPWAEAKAALEYQRRVQEQKELTGKPVNQDSQFKEVFGRSRGNGKQFLPKGISPYRDY